MDHAIVELGRSTLAAYRCLWEAHTEPRLGGMPLRDIDARRVVPFWGELLAAGVGSRSVVETLAMLQRVPARLVTLRPCRSPRPSRS